MTHNCCILCLLLDDVAYLEERIFDFKKFGVYNFKNCLHVTIKNYIQSNRDNNFDCLHGKQCIEYPIHTIFLLLTENNTKPKNKILEQNSKKASEKFNI